MVTSCLVQQVHPFQLPVFSKSFVSSCKSSVKALGSICSRLLIISAIYISETCSIENVLSAYECNDQVKQQDGRKDGRACVQATGRRTDQSHISWCVPASVEPCRGSFPDTAQILGPTAEEAPIWASVNQFFKMASANCDCSV